MILTFTNNISDIEYSPQSEVRILLDVVNKFYHNYPEQIQNFYKGYLDSIIALEHTEDEIKISNEINSIIKGEKFVDIYLVYLIAFIASVLGFIKAIYF